jgi:DNA-binding transcriptional LysR family regulator
MVCLKKFFLDCSHAQVLLSEGKAILEQYDSMLHKLNQVSPSSTSMIEVGWPMGYTVHYLNSIMSINSQSKGFNIKMTEDSFDVLFQLLLEKKLHFLLTPALYSHPDLIYTNIRREEFYLAIPKNHVANDLISQDNMTPYADLSELKDMPFISLYARPYKEFIKPLFQEADFSPNIIFVCNNWDSSHSLVEKGLGLSIVPYWFAEKGHESINYYRIKSRQKTYRTFACTYHRSQVMTPEFQTFIDYVKDLYGDEHAHTPFDYSILMNMPQ